MLKISRLDSWTGPAARAINVRVEAGPRRDCMRAISPDDVTVGRVVNVTAEMADDVGLVSEDDIGRRCGLSISYEL